MHVLHWVPMIRVTQQCRKHTSYSLTQFYHPCASFELALCSAMLITKANHLSEKYQCVVTYHSRCLCSCLSRMRSLNTFTIPWAVPILRGSPSDSDCRNQNVRIGKKSVPILTWFQNHDVYPNLSWTPWPISPWTPRRWWLWRCHQHHGACTMCILVSRPDAL